MCSFGQNLVIFALFCVRVSKVGSFWPPTKSSTFRRKLSFWLKIDVIRCLKAKIAKNVFILTKFGVFCTILRESHQSQFFVATYKKQHFSAKIEYFWLKMDVIRCLKANIAKNVFNLTTFGDFCTILRESLQSWFFLATYKKQHFSAKIEYFWLKIDVIRCLKAKIAKNVFILTKFGVFCTILRESHQSQFFVATYKKQHFSAKIEYFWLEMDVIRCLKAKIAKNVFKLTKIGYFCTNLHESHQSQFFFRPPTENCTFWPKLISFGQKWL